MSSHLSVYSVWALIRLSRPLFLAGGLVLHGLGIAIALYTGAPLNPHALLWGQLAITAIQLMTHFNNEYFDREADAANLTPTFWSGGSRVLVEGLLSPVVALTAAGICAVLALLATLVLATTVRPEPFTAPLLIGSLVLAWGYSAPPLQFHSKGLGELVSALLVAGMTPLVGFYLQTGAILLLPLLAVVPLVCLQFNMLLAVGLPDADGDALTGKRTLVVQLGRKHAGRLYQWVLVIPYILLPFLVCLGLPQLVAAAAFLGLPVAIWRIWRIYDWLMPPRWNGVQFWSVTLLIGTAILEAAAFMALAM